MAKSKRDIGREILNGLRELKRGEYGRVVNVPDVAGVREKTGLSQAQFAALLGVSVRTLQDWEQGRRAPSGAARTAAAGGQSQSKSAPGSGVERESNSTRPHGRRRRLQQGLGVIDDRDKVPSFNLFPRAARRSAGASKPH